MLDDLGDFNVDNKYLIHEHLDDCPLVLLEISPDLLDLLLNLILLTNDLQVVRLPI